MNKATITAHGVTIVIEQDAPITAEQIADVLKSIANSQPIQCGPVSGMTLNITPPCRALTPPKEWPEPGTAQYPLASRSHPIMHPTT